MSLYTYTTEQQLTLVKSFAILDKVYQKDNVLYWRQDYRLEGPASYIAVDLNWLSVDFNKHLPENAIAHSFGTSRNLASMVIGAIAEDQGWDRYPVSMTDIKNSVESLINKVDILSYEDPDVILKELDLEDITKDYQFWPKESAMEKAIAKMKTKLIKAIHKKVEEAIKEAAL